MATLIELKALSLAYGDYTALADMSLQLEEGEFVAIVGASGVGKSTLLRVLAGLAKPTTGSVTTRFRTDPAHRPTAMMFQDARLLPWRRALGNVLFALEGLGLPKAERLAKAKAALRLVGLSDYERRWPYQLSGGQRQRVALARALTVQPELLLLDEPFGALDAMTRASLQDELLRIWQSTGCSVLFVTHDLDEAAYLADRVVLLGGSPARVVSDIQIPEPRPRLRGALTSVSSIKEELQRTIALGSDI